MEQKARFVLKAQNETLFSILEELYKKKTLILKQNRDIETIKDIIRGVKYFGNGGYYFAFTLDGTVKVYPPNPALEEKNFLRVSEPSGKRILKDIIKKIETDKQSFFKYNWFEIGSKRTSPKLSYVKIFKPMNWVIGTGVPLSILTEEIKRNLTEETKIWRRELGDFFVILDNSRSVVTGRLPKILLENPDMWKNQIIKKGKDPKGGFIYFNGDPTKSHLPNIVMQSFYYKRLGWTVAIGVSNKKFEDQIAKKRTILRKGIIYSFIFISTIMILIVSLMLFLSTIFRNQIKNSFNTFTEFFNKARSEYRLIDIENLRFHEFRKLAKYANDMITERLKKDNIIKEFTQKLEKANLQLKEIANMDGLTQIANRRRFDEVLSTEWGRAMRDDNIISLGLIDIDFFKKFNDTYGHQKGDECLQLFASALKNSIKRPSDLIARYGGEEFVVLLPGTDISGALMIAEKMKSSIEDLNMVHSESTVSDVVTFSMGIATLVPSKGAEPESIVGFADKALYQAKSEGRNRNVVYQD
jgi:diguanylate cyclase (GGDEF)-like protein